MDFEKLDKILDDKQTQIDIKAYFDEINEKHEKAMKIVSSTEYHDWISSFCQTHETCDDEAALYTYEDTNAEYGNLLPNFIDYLKDLAKEQNIPVGCDETCAFVNEELYFQYKEHCFKAFRMYGQGSYSCVVMVKKESKRLYVNLV